MSEALKSRLQSVRRLGAGIRCGLASFGMLVAPCGAGHRGASNVHTQFGDCAVPRRHWQRGKYLCLPSIIPKASLWKICLRHGKCSRISDPYSEKRCGALSTLNRDDFPMRRQNPGSCISKSANGLYTITYARNPANLANFAIDLQRPPRFLQPHAIPPITCNPSK